MDIIGADEEMAKQRTNFFNHIFGRAEGYVCVATLSDTKRFNERFYHYPKDLSLMVADIQASVQGNNLYFCPQLFGVKKRNKENVVVTPNAWSDLDFCIPENLLIEPTIVVESSPGRYQAYWVFKEDVDPDDAENLSKRIAYHHVNEGADISGWDLTQLLRIPLTFNYKYIRSEEVPVVKIIAASRKRYALSDFEEYPKMLDYEFINAPMPEIDISITADILLQARRLTLNPRVWSLFIDIPNGKDSWSNILWNLEMLLFESGFIRSEVFVIVKEAGCNKYERDGKPAYLLWKEVCRAEQKAMLHMKLLVPKAELLVSLLTAEERERVEGAGDTFVERYIRWAADVGDAAIQYHQAGAFTILSSLFSGSIRLPTSFGVIIPNLWFCILADTTLTRKSSSMDLAMDLLMDVDENVIMATDGSLEGLLTGLASRPGQPSIFLRDEFSGLLEAMAKKDYMAGMAELLTKLYDGKMQKRMLRKEVIEVRDPRLIFYAGGIKNKITNLLTYEQVSSGFMPRFIFITAESDLNKVKPIGPPTTKSQAGRNAILDELIMLQKHYDKSAVLHIEKLKADVTHKIYYDVTLTDDAWVRYNMLESELLSIGLKHEHPEIMTPVGDRLAKSILKAAMLLAASRKQGDEVIMEEIDLLIAINYGEQWRMHAQEVMEQVGKGSSERQLDLIIKLIERRPGGISRSEVMQMHHLDARTASQTFETLEQRGLITRQKSGRTELLIATRKL